MCEYCGCQAVAAIAELTREHDEVVALISRVRASHGAGDVAGMAVAARQIAAVLGPHTAVEEEGLFPPLADEFPEHVAELTAQHRLIDAVLREAATRTPVDPAWPGRLMDALHLLREHILAEQDGVFPAALASLTTADWESVEAARARVDAGAAIAAGEPRAGYAGPSARDLRGLEPATRVGDGPVDQACRSS